MNRIGMKKLLALLMSVCLLMAAVPAYAADNAVTVYFTLSSDGVPVSGRDGTVLARHEVSVPYFDLGLYGLSYLYRYETEGEFGDYINTTIVKKPTVLHLYIYMLERYYQGLPKSECGKGNLDMNLVANSSTRDGQRASQGEKALYITGGAKSMYMANFWGHDENLMYFVNHQYPLMNAGWGSTADYILLKSGMEIDVAMFSNWAFYNYGSFMYFDQDSYSFSTGQQQTLRVLGGRTSVVTDGDFTPVTPVAGIPVYLWSRDMKTSYGQIGMTDKYGYIDYTFDQAGTYLVSAEDPNRGTKDAAHAPAVATVKVVENSTALEGISFDEQLYNLEYGNTLQLVPTLMPADATNVTMTWTSSDTSMVSVNDIGVLNGKGSGTVTVTCEATDGKNTYSASCEVYVGKVVPVEGVDITQDNITIEVGETVQMEYSILPADASTQAVLWRTSECPNFDQNYTDEEHTIARINHMGLLTGKKPGTVSVYVKTADGGYTDVCRVKVVKATTPAEPDVSGDGKTDANDAVLILKYAAEQITLETAQIALADMDGNGTVNANDAVLLLKYCAAN